MVGVDLIDSFICNKFLFLDPKDREKRGRRALRSMSFHGLSAGVVERLAGQC